jgi:hypothetical protein
MIERARDHRWQNEDVGTYYPDHFAPMTWRRCIVDGCAERIDPWTFRARCPEHDAAPVDLERVRELVDAGRRQAAAIEYRRRYDRD